MGVTSYVGLPHAMINIETLQDAWEVVDYVHTLVMDAPKISDADRACILDKLESLLETINERGL